MVQANQRPSDGFEIPFDPTAYSLGAVSSSGLDDDFTRVLESCNRKDPDTEKKNLDSTS